MSIFREPHHRIRIGGIKLSSELFLFTYHRSVKAICHQDRLLAAISARNINLTFLTCARQQNEVTTSFCSTSDHQFTILQLAHEAGISESEITCISGTGILTLFPHGNKLEILGNVLKLFSLHGFSVYGACTSVSTLSILTDYTLLEQATHILEEIFELPDNHSPMRQHISIRQISRENPAHKQN